MTPEIRKTPIGGQLKDFLKVVDYIYRDDAQYIRPLDYELKQRLSPKHPFFDHAEGVLLTAYRNGFCIGRCTAQIDREHLARYRDDVGFFGLLDTIDDESVAMGLLAAAAEWLSERGLKRMRGPFSLSVNDELGCLVEGFDTPPMVMMPHHRPYQGGLIEAAGLPKLKDLYAWRYVVGDVPARARRAHDEIQMMPELKARSCRVKELAREVRTIVDVFNDAWSENWGFVPYTERELRALADMLKLIIRPELSLIVEIDGEPAAVAVALPNINEALVGLNGKLSPVNVAKLLWRFKVRGPRTARLAILGIRKKFRGMKKYAALSTFMYAKMNHAGQRCGIDWGELSWTLEDNAPVNVGIKFMGGKVYKRYRLYERAL